MRWPTRRRRKAIKGSPGARVVAFRVFEHTADVGLEVESETLDGLFTDAARGLFQVVRGDNQVAPRETHTIQVSGSNLDRLFLAFLEELVFLQDAEGLVFRDLESVTVGQETDRWQAGAVVHGEPFDHEKHPGCLHVKAVTRHELSVQPPGPSTPARARLILDI